MGETPTFAWLHGAMMDAVPEPCLELMCHLESYGYEAYAVGGCVRDVIIGREPHDWDITTSATPVEMKRALADFRSIDTGIEHGTVTFMVEGEPYEVTTFRSDGDYSDGRHPDRVSFATTVGEDLARRDFTMNAIAWNRSGIVDPFGGLEDASRGLVRCVGSPAERFSEDSLRVLRAVRFASALGFKLEPVTAAAANGMSRGLDRVSRERIHSELVKTFDVADGTHLAQVLDDNRDVLFAAFGCDELREMVGYDQQSKYHDRDLWRHTLDVVAGVQDPDDMAITRIAALFHDVGKPMCAKMGDDGYLHFIGHPKASRDVAYRVLSETRFSRGELEHACFLVEQHDNRPRPTVGPCRRFIVRCDGDEGREADLFALMRSDVAAHAGQWTAKPLYDLAQAQSLVAKLHDVENLFTVRDLAIDGNDLKGLGFAEGPELGACLHGLFDEVVAGRLENEREVLLARVCGDYGIEGVSDVTFTGHFS